jgi:hypothetical protein
MAYTNKAKGKTYPLLPCVECGADVEKPSQPYYAPKARCLVCDRKHRNRKKAERKQAKKPTIYCLRCETPFPHGAHLSKKYCEKCTTIKETNVRAKRKAARMEKLKGHTCVDCHVDLKLDEEYLKNPSMRGKPRTRCERCAHVKRNKEKSAAGYKHDMGSAFRQIKKRCKAKGLPFDLTIEDLVVPDECPVLKIPIIPASLGGVNPMMPSVDRHVPEKGYTKENIVIMSHRANSLKSNAAFEEIEALYLYLKSKKTEN